MKIQESIKKLREELEFLEGVIVAIDAVDTAGLPAWELRRSGRLAVELNPAEYCGRSWFYSGSATEGQPMAAVEDVLSQYRKALAAWELLGKRDSHLREWHRKTSDSLSGSPVSVSLQESATYINGEKQERTTVDAVVVKAYYLLPRLLPIVTRKARRAEFSQIEIKPGSLFVTFPAGKLEQADAFKDWLLSLCKSMVCEVCDGTGHCRYCEGEGCTECEGHTECANCCNGVVMEWRE